MKLYTAIGALVSKQAHSFHAVVRLGNREYELQTPETILWGCAVNNIYSEEELRDSFHKAMEQCNLENTVEFDCWLSRMLQRGLIISGEGKLGIDALRELFTRVKLVPTRCRGIAKLCAFLHMTIVQRHSPRVVWRNLPNLERPASARRFRRMNPDEKEYQLRLREEHWLHRRLCQSPQTTGEIIRLFEDMTGGKGTQRALSAISNLYLNRKIRLEAV